MMYSMVITTGPLRGRMSSAIFRLRPPTERVEVRALSTPAGRSAGRKRLQPTGRRLQISRALAPHPLRKHTPDPATERHAAEGRHLVERERAANDPARRGQLHGGIEARERQHPTGAAKGHRDHGEDARAQARHIAQTAKPMKADRTSDSIDKGLAQTGAEKSPTDRTNAECPEQDAIGERSALNQVARDRAASGPELQSAAKPKMAPRKSTTPIFGDIAT